MCKDGKGGDIFFFRWRNFPPPAHINVKRVWQKVWRDQKRSAGKKRTCLEGERDFPLHGINPELDSKSLTLSQPVLTDTQTACNISPHMCCPSSPLSLLSTWAVWQVFVYCHSYSALGFLLEHTLRLRYAIARMNKHSWRGLVGRCSHAMCRCPFLIALFKPEAVLSTCIAQRLYLLVRRGKKIHLKVFWSFFSGRWVPTNAEQFQVRIMVSFTRNKSVISQDESLSKIPVIR